MTSLIITMRERRWVYIKTSLFVSYYFTLNHYGSILLHFVGAPLAQQDLVPVIPGMVAALTESVRMVWLVNMLALESSLRIAPAMVAWVAHVPCSVDAVQVLADRKVEEVWKQVIHKLDLSATEIQDHLTVFTEELIKVAQLLSSDRLIKRHTLVTLFTFQA